MDDLPGLADEVPEPSGPRLGPDDVPGPLGPRLDPDDVRGRHLRFCLLTVMGDGGGVWSIPELRERLGALGLTVGGSDPSKTVADVLRYECAKGRAERVGRGRYRALPRPDTTIRRHRDRPWELRAARAQLTVSSQAGAGETTQLRMDAGGSADGAGYDVGAVQ